MPSIASGFVRLWLSALGLLVVLVAGTAYSGFPGNRQAGVFSFHPSTPYFHYSPTGAPSPFGRILVVHGLDSSKEVMNLLSYALADAGFEVYSIDLPGHGDSREPFDGLGAKRAVEKALDEIGPVTAVLGHSFGAAILLDLASDREFGAMVLLSPPPSLVDQMHAKRILVMSGRFDLPAIRKFIPSLGRMELDQIDTRSIAWAGHTGYVVRPEVHREIVEWLGGDSSHLRSQQRAALLAAMLAGAVVLGIAALSGTDIPAARAPAGRVVLPYIAAALVAYLLSAVVVLLAWLKLFATDYLISFLLSAGIALCIWHRPPLGLSKRALARAVLAAVYVAITLGFIASEFGHVSLTGGRWWRFVVIAAAGLPLLLVDETHIRPLRPWWKAALVVTLTRLILLGFIGTGVLTLNRNDAFIILLLHLMLAFWILLWLAGEIIRRHTQDAPATALFIALIQAWVFAAIFVTT